MEPETCQSRRSAKGSPVDPSNIPYFTLDIQVTHHQPVILQSKMASDCEQAACTHVHLNVSEHGVQIRVHSCSHSPATIVELKVNVDWYTQCMIVD